jgi:dihydrofolate reductase
MRKIIASNCISIDGFIEGPNKEIDWFVWDEDMENYSKNMLNSVDSILFGRVTYALMAGFWPTTAAVNEDPVITEAMNNLPKIVFSKTLEKVEWNNSRLIKDNIKEEVIKLKQKPGKDIVIFGSGILVSSFAQMGLIDEYRFIINPIILGKGNPQFKNINNRHHLKLLETKSFKCGNVILYYKPDSLG